MYIFALISVAVRCAFTLRLLRQASLTIFGKGARLRTSNDGVWRAPPDLHPHLTPEAKSALSKMVAGAHTHLKVTRLAETPSAAEPVSVRRTDELSSARGS